jgi:hypothetical protein
MEKSHLTAESLVSVAEAFERPALDWKVEAVPLYFPDGAASGWRQIRRTDNGQTFGPPVSDGYTVFQNGDLRSFAEQAAKAMALPDRCAASAGDFGDGRLYIGLYAPTGHRVVSARDRKVSLDTHFNVGVGHGGTATLWGGPEGFLVICENTFRAAMAKADFRVKHTASMPEKVKAILEALAYVPTYADTLANRAELLLGRSVTPTEKREWIGRIALAEITGDTNNLRVWGVSLDDIVEETMRQDATTRRLTRYRETAESIRDLANRGPGNTGESAWDILQGLTDYTDHHRPFRQSKVVTASEQRLAYAHAGGAGDQLKLATLEALVDWTNSGQPISAA